MKIAGTVRLLLVGFLALGCCGCLTYRDRVAYKRAELGMAERAKEGDDLAAAQATELGEANQDTGADSISPAEAPLDAAAARDNARGIAQARAGRAAIKDFVLGAVQSLASQWPGVGALIGLGGGLVVALRKLLQYRKAAETVIEGVGTATAAGGDIKATIKSLALDYGIQPFLDKLVQKFDPPEEA